MHEPLQMEGIAVPLISARIKNFQRFFAAPPQPTPPPAEQASTGGKLRSADVVAAMILMVLAAVIAVTTIVVAYPSLSPLPLYDQWGFLEPSYIWRTLFAVHSEHRIVLSKLVFLADLCWLGGKNIAEFIVTAMMLLAIGGVYWAAVGLDRFASWTHRALAAAMVICFAISPLTIGVLLWGMHVQNVGVNLFAVAAFFLLALAASKGPAIGARYGALSLAIAFGVFATFTSANGLLVSFLLIVEALGLRLRRREITWIAAAAVIAAALFLHGNTAQGNTIKTITASPWGVTRFFFLFLGSIVPQAMTLSDAPTHQPLVFALGLASVVVLAFNTFVYVRRSRCGACQELAVFSLVSGMFFLSSAALVATGRYPFGIDHAYTEHYNILRVLYWANLLLSIGACWKTPRAWQLVGALAICAAVVLCMEIPSRMSGLKYRDAALNTSAAAIATEVYDMGAWSGVNQWNESNPATHPFMRRQAELLRQNNWSVFHDAPAAWTGQNIRRLPLADTSCAGAITESQIRSDQKGQYQIVLGWIDHPVASDKEPQIVLVDGSGNIIGFGAIGAARNGQAQWKGYARSEIAPAGAYLFSAGALCRLTNKS
jgi:hypothetical protein